MISSLTLHGTVRNFLRQLQVRFEQEFAANDRLKWLASISITLLYTAFVLYIAGQAGEARNELNLAREQLSQIRAQALETRWPDRTTQAQALISDLEKRFWSGSTPGLAEAGFERWIRQTFDQHGVQVRQVQLTRGPILENGLGAQKPTLSSVQQIRAKVISPLDEIALVRFLNDAASHKSWLVVEQLIVRPGRNPRLEMDLATFFRTPQPNP